MSVQSVAAMWAANQAKKERRKEREVQQSNAWVSNLCSVQRLVEEKSGTSAGGGGADEEQHQSEHCAMVYEPGWRARCSAGIDQQGSAVTATLTGRMVLLAAATMMFPKGQNCAGYAPGETDSAAMKGGVFVFDGISYGDSAFPSGLCARW